MQRPVGTHSRRGGQFLIRQMSPAPLGDACQRSSHTFKEKYARILDSQDIPTITPFRRLLRESRRIYGTREYTSGPFFGQAQAISK
jgi:hypothetical protein